MNVTNSFSFLANIEYFSKFTLIGFTVFFIAPLIIYLILLTIENIILYFIGNKFTRFYNNSSRFFKYVTFFDFTNILNWFNISIIIIILILIGGTFCVYYGITLYLTLEVIALLAVTFGFVIKTPINDAINNNRLANMFKIGDRIKLITYNNNNIKDITVTIEKIDSNYLHGKTCIINKVDDVKKIYKKLKIPIVLVRNAIWFQEPSSEISARKKFQRKNYDQQLVTMVEESEPDETILDNFSDFN
jgi:hypothetical protein